MAIIDVGKSTLDIRLGKRDGKVYSLAVIGEVTVTRSINSAACMRLTVYRDEITPEKGEFIAFRLDGVHDFFYGTIEETSKSKDKVELTCYDQMYFLANNTYTTSYGTLKADELIVRMCDDFGFTQVDPPTVADTEYPIKNVILQNRNLLDVLVDALNITYRNTGKKFYIYDYFNNLCLDSGDNDETLKVNTCIITPETCEDYSYKESLDGFYNRITVETKEENQADRKKVVAEDTDSIARFGLREYYSQVDDGENIDNVAKTLLEDKDYLKYKMSISGQIGDPRVVGGSSVYVDFYGERYRVREYIRGWFRVDSATHHFENATHTMDLELTLLQMDDDWERTDPII